MERELSRAIVAGDAPAVDALLAADPGLAARPLGESGVTALFLAAKHGRADVAAAVLPLLRTPEQAAASPAGSTADPITVAARRGHLDVLRAMRASPLVSASGYPLSLAVYYDSVSPAAMAEVLQFPSAFASHCATTAFQRMLKLDGGDPRRPRTRLLLQHTRPDAHPERLHWYYRAILETGRREWALVEALQAMGSATLLRTHPQLRATLPTLLKQDMLQAARLLVADGPPPDAVVHECCSVAMVRLLAASPHARPLLARRLAPSNCTLLATFLSRRRKRHNPGRLVRALLEALDPDEREELFHVPHGTELYVHKNARQAPAAYEVAPHPSTPLGMGVAGMACRGEAIYDHDSLVALLDLLPPTTRRDDRLVPRLLRASVDFRGHSHPYRAPSREPAGVMRALLEHPSVPPCTLLDLRDAVAAIAALAAHVVERRYGPKRLEVPPHTWALLRQCLWARRTAASPASAGSDADLREQLRRHLRALGCPAELRERVDHFGLWGRRGPLVRLRALVHARRAFFHPDAPRLLRSSVERLPSRPWREVLSFL